MGEIADYYVNKMLDDRHYPKYPTTKKIVWTTDDGKEYEPKDMEISYIMNVIHLCERREGLKGIKFLNNAPTYKALVNELIDRGKLDNTYFDMHLDDRLKVKIKE
ncbi:hypothetical protein ACFQZE_06780 [Paenibacillus sp. GCM10027627]|uniref:hypothetical protein n=1 Tax=unclassified Paenibacillus TaxID=185978 RepID=UPI00362A2836